MSNIVGRVTRNRLLDNLMLLLFVATIAFDEHNNPVISPLSIVN